MDGLCRLACVFLVALIWASVVLPVAPTCSESDGVLTCRGNCSLTFAEDAPTFDTVYQLVLTNVCQPLATNVFRVLSGLLRVTCPGPGDTICSLDNLQHRRCPCLRYGAGSPDIDDGDDDHGSGDSRAQSSLLTDIPDATVPIISVMATVSEAFTGVGVTSAVLPLSTQIPPSDPRLDEELLAWLQSLWAGVDPWQTLSSVLASLLSLGLIYGLYRMSICMRLRARHARRPRRLGTSRAPGLPMHLLRHLPDAATQAHVPMNVTAGPTPPTVGRDSNVPAIPVSMASSVASPASPTSANSTTDGANSTSANLTSLSPSMVSPLSITSADPVFDPASSRPATPADGLTYHVAFPNVRASTSATFCASTPMVDAFGLGRTAVTPIMPRGTTPPAPKAFLRPATPMPYAATTQAMAARVAPAHLELSLTTPRTTHSSMSYWVGLPSHPSRGRRACSTPVHGTEGREKGVPKGACGTLSTIHDETEASSTPRAHRGAPSDSGMDLYLGPCTTLAETVDAERGLKRRPY